MVAIDPPGWLADGRMVQGLAQWGILGSIAGIARMGWAAGVFVVHDGGDCKGHAVAIVSMGGSGVMRMVEYLVVMLAQPLSAWAVLRSSEGDWRPWRWRRRDGGRLTSWCGCGCGIMRSGGN
jgi:hypothetical protein